MHPLTPCNALGPDPRAHLRTCAVRGDRDSGSRTRAARGSAAARGCVASRRALTGGPAAATKQKLPRGVVLGEVRERVQEQEREWEQEREQEQEQEQEQEREQERGPSRELLPGLRV